MQHAVGRWLLAACVVNGDGSTVLFERLEVGRSTVKFRGVDLIICVYAGTRVCRLARAPGWSVDRADTRVGRAGGQVDERQTYCAAQIFRVPGRLKPLDGK